MSQATDVFKKRSRCDPEQVYLVPSSQKGWTETTEEPISLCAPIPCSASESSPGLGFPRDGKQGARASKPRQGLQAVNEPREAARRGASTARGLGLHRTNAAACWCLRSRI